MGLGVLCFARFELVKFVALSLLKLNDAMAIGLCRIEQPRTA
jgi:hypothetical protein